MLETLEILFDVGLLILIWMVQLIIYPSFLYYTHENLLLWHQKYTGRIAVIVMPLMFGQLGFSIYLVYESIAIMSIAKLVLVLFVWGFTFAYFAPCHEKISKGVATKELLSQLINWNWWRTLAWTLVLIISLYQLIIK